MPGLHLVTLSAELFKNDFPDLLSENDFRFPDGVKFIAAQMNPVDLKNSMH